MGNNIGNRLKQFRKQRGLTQKELAKDICTQAMISNFESGDSSPSSLVLFQLANRLQIDINAFFTNDLVIKENTSILNIKKIITKLVSQHEYQSVDYIVQNELAKQEDLSPEDKQFLYWHQGICSWQLQKDSQQALSLLKQALEYSNINPQIISIHNSMAIIYFEQELYDEALSEYEVCLLLIKELATPDIQLINKIYFGISRVYTYQEQYKEALLYCDYAIRNAIESESLYLLGELLFHKGRTYLQMNDQFNSNQAFSQAKVIFELTGKLEYLNIIKRIEYERLASIDPA